MNTGQGSTISRATKARRDARGFLRAFAPCLSPMGKMRRAGWICCMLASLPLFASVASVYISPAKVPFAALLCLGFPAFMVLNLMGLVAGVFIRRKAWLLPTLALFVSLPSLYAYCPVTLFPSQPKDADTLRILTFNTRNFGGHVSDSAGRNYVGTLMVDQKADIVCFQEGAIERRYYNECIFPLLKRRYRYMHICLHRPHSPMGIFSRWPVIGEEIVAESGRNVVTAYRLLRAKDDTLLVVNAHLASIGLSDAQREMYSQAVRGYVSDADRQGGLRAIVQAFCRAASRRALMADTVAEYLRRNSSKPIILCGDFNDTPVSYARMRIAGELKDCFQAAGNGISRTFCRNSIVVRIDHIFCSEHWQPVNCHTVPGETYSDHYPMVCTLIRKRP